MTRGREFLDDFDCGVRVCPVVDVVFGSVVDLGDVRSCSGVGLVLVPVVEIYFLVRRSVIGLLPHGQRP